MRNEIVRTLATQMFCYDPKPRKDFCMEVAKMLVRKYPFMRDMGERVSGYVTDIIIIMYIKFSIIIMHYLCDLMI